LTYSIVARDSKTGQFGVAVQSHYFSVGSVVTWARAGVGAVATQAMVDVKYGPLGLELMASGKSAHDSLESLLRTDLKRETRQVAMVDAEGNVAVHTGAKCIPHAGHAVGKGFSCQGNIVKSRMVWKAMRRTFAKNSEMPFPERLLSALEAGEEAGGDARGKQSSAILVVERDLRPSHWEGRLFDLRVEDHPEPIAELKRLLRYQRGYDWVNKGDDLLTSKKYAAALRVYSRGLVLVPEVLELKYWVGLSMLKTRKRGTGVRMLREVFEEDRNWIGITKWILKTRMIQVEPGLLRVLFDEN